jgi:hypothetical protein
MKRILRPAIFLWLAALARLSASNGFAYDATDKYEARQLEGWTLRINQALLKNETLAKDTLRLLEFQLYQIKRVVPGPALAELQKTAIWIELAGKDFPCMCYHPSAQWLREHDFNPEKAGGVEISNATNFLQWTKEQPWMVLHELAHSYHHKVLGYEHAGIKGAYQHAAASKKYESVRHISGRMQRHYALNNDQEYFAESTEAFFGTNDFYPFVRAELQEMDPEMYHLLRKVWDVDGAAAAKSTSP